MKKAIPTVERIINNLNLESMIRAAEKNMNDTNSLFLKEYYGGLMQGYIDVKDLLNDEIKELYDIK